MDNEYFKQAIGKVSAVTVRGINQAQDALGIRLKPGDIVKHFKNETVEDKTQYIYKILYIARDVETDTKVVVYEALYACPEKGINYDIFTRPYDVFMSRVDKVKYPMIKQIFRYEKIG